MANAASISDQRGECIVKKGGGGGRLAARMETSANEQLLDKLVGDRLSRIFDGQIKKEKTNEIFQMMVDSRSVCGGGVNGENGTYNNDKNQYQQCDEELIDAGLDLSPDDLQKLPDLSYEE